MPTEASAAIDLRNVISEMITDAAKTYSSDLNWIPEDKFHAVPMGSGRSPADFTAECIGFNRMVARIIKDEKVHFPTDEEHEAFVRSFDTIGKAKNEILESARDLVDALKLIAPDDLWAEVTPPWGQPVATYKMASLAASHMSYHDGQVNYIQTLYGDVRMHWE